MDVDGADLEACRDLWFDQVNGVFGAGGLGVELDVEVHHHLSLFATGREVLALIFELLQEVTALVRAQASFLLGVLLQCRTVSVSAGEMAAEYNV